MEQEEYQKVLEYHKGLIAFRKAHSILRPDSVLIGVLYVAVAAAAVVAIGLRRKKKHK